MKTANAALVAILAGDRFLYGDLYTFALRNGTTKYYTDWGMDLTIGGNTYKSGACLISGAKYRVERGLNVDESDLTVYPDPAETVNGLAFVRAVRVGLLDRAIISRQRQFINPDLSITANAPLIFLGEITDSSPSRNQATLKVKSMPNLLNTYMPRRQYQPHCTWVFGDANCTIARAPLTVSNAATAGSTSGTINCTVSDGAGTYNNGVLTFTSGANNGLKRNVKSYSPGVVVLTAPFPTLPTTGDTFSLSPGCTKNLAGPTQSFNAAATAGSTVTVINNTLSNAAGFFNGGTLEFTSGPNVGQSRTVSLWVPGQASLASAFPNEPQTGGGSPPTPQDSFTITSSSGNTVASCTGYNNIIHFGGMPFIPVPETAY